MAAGGHSLVKGPSKTERESALQPATCTAHFVSFRDLA